MYNVKIKKENKGNYVTGLSHVLLICTIFLVCAILVVYAIYNIARLHKFECRVIQTEDCYVYAVDEDENVWCFTDYRFIEDDWILLTINNNLTKTKADDIVMKVNPIY